ncbi:MAG: hypothetical protein U5K38_00785 [Woeseiaceae bacterium]|nr:hypothetical protein [Woeseiaceae bacterium]
MRPRQGITTARDEFDKRTLGGFSLAKPNDYLEPVAKTEGQLLLIKKHDAEPGMALL